MSYVWRRNPRDDTAGYLTLPLPIRYDLRSMLLFRPQVRNFYQVYLGD